MSTEESRRVAIEWYKCLEEFRVDDLIVLAAPGATWWVSGLKEISKFTGALPYAERALVIRELFGVGMKSYKFNLLSITAEGDTAVLEGSPSGESKDGRIFTNDLMVKLVVKDGKIQSVKEYIDLFVLFKFMGVPVPSL
ncbi:hypothetical protein B0H34DRAFT_722339 [Crassisporium funariophilum]|nr:hypothetical protein B0H34DRAFT_722339 [Crassisporium funariophilum]